MRFTRAGVPMAMMLTFMVAAVVSLIPAAHFQIMRPAAVATVLAARGLVEIFAAYLAGQRFVRTASGLYLGIAVALGVMAVGHLGFLLTPPVFSPDGEATAVLPYELVGAAVLAAAAPTPRRALVRRPRRSLILSAVAALSMLLLLLAQLGDIPSLAGPDGGEPSDLASLRLVTGALLAAAGLALVANRDARSEPFTKWLTVAVGLAALAQLERVAESPSGFGLLTWTHVFLLGYVAALLAGAVEEIRDQQRRLAEGAVANERRRVARDLHDGLAQEVAFIASQSKHLAVESGDRRLDEIAVAAERALDDSRAVVGALSRPSGAPLSASIAQQAQDFARRWGLRVELALEPEIAVPPEEEQAILRIVGEALSNTARHAHASTVGIRLDRLSGPLHLAIIDDGRGFDPEAECKAGHGFGLHNMRERARLVGGDVRFVSEPGRGTRVEIALP
jgi:signal transduction histidine kinase